MHRRFYNGQFRQRAMAFDFLPGSLICDSMAYLLLSFLKILNEWWVERRRLVYEIL